MGVDDYISNYSAGRAFGSFFTPNISTADREADEILKPFGYLQKAEDKHFTKYSSPYPVDNRLDMVKDGKDPYSFTPQQYEWERVWGPGGTFTQAVKEAVEEGVKAYQDAAVPSWVEDMVGRIEDPLAGIAAGLR